MVSCAPCKGTHTRVLVAVSKPHASTYTTGSEARSAENAGDGAVTASAMAARGAETLKVMIVDS